MFRRLFQNPVFQTAYLISAVCFLAVVHYTQSTGIIPQFVITLLLIVHIGFLLSKLDNPGVFTRLLMRMRNQDTRSSYLSQRTVPKRNANEIYVLEAQDGRYADIQRTLINGIASTVKQQKRVGGQQGNIAAARINPGGYVEQRNSFARPETNQMFYSMDERKRAEQPGPSRYLERDYIRRIDQYSRNEMEDFELNSHLPEASPDSVYIKAGLKATEKLRMLMLVRNHIRYLSENQQAYTKELDEQIQLIFGQRLNDEPGPNNLSFADVAKLLKGYNQYRSVPKQYFRGSKTDILDADFTRQMKKLQQLFEDIPPSVNLSNRRSVFMFYLWFVKKMLYPQKVQVYQKMTYVERAYATISKVIVDDTIGGMFYVYKEQIDCQYNVQETFLFTLMSGRPKDSVNIVRQLIRLNKDSY